MYYTCFLFYFHTSSSYCYISLNSCHRTTRYTGIIHPEESELAHRSLHQVPLIKSSSFNFPVPLHILIPLLRLVGLDFSALLNLCVPSFVSVVLSQLQSSSQSLNDNGTKSFRSHKLGVFHAIITQKVSTIEYRHHTTLASHPQGSRLDIPTPIESSTTLPRFTLSSGQEPLNSVLLAKLG